MARHRAEPVRTYAIGFHEAAYDESPFAAAAAARFGAHHTSERVDADMLSLWPLAIWHCDQPHGDVSFMPTYRVAELAARGAKGGQMWLGEPAGQAAHHERGLEHGGGLVEVNEVEFVGRGGGFALGQQVFHLSADQVSAPCGLTELAHQGGGKDRFFRIGVAEQGKSVGQQRIACQHRGALVVGLVHGWASAAQVVVVHARQIVMDQRIGVQALDRHGSRHGISLRRSGG